MAKWKIKNIIPHHATQTYPIHRFDIVLLELERDVDTIKPIEPVAPLFYKHYILEDHARKVSVFGYGRYRLNPISFEEIPGMSDSLRGVSFR